MNMSLSSKRERCVPNKVLKWVAAVNAAIENGATEREVRSLGEYDAMCQWHMENADNWHLMEELVDTPDGERSRYSFMHEDSPEYCALWDNWRKDQMNR